MYISAFYNHIQHLSLSSVQPTGIYNRYGYMLACAVRVRGREVQCMHQARRRNGWHVCVCIPCTDVIHLSGDILMEWPGLKKE